MDTLQKGIILLLRSAITGERLALPEDFDLSAAAEVARRHHMAPLIYAGAVNCGMDREDPELRQLFQHYCRAMAVSEGQMRDYARICAAFDENGIDYMPLKGVLMKPRYPKPELRMMGDADILIRVDQYDRIAPVMEALGFREKLESDHELSWQSRQLYVELHKRLIPSYNGDFHAYFGDGWRLAKVKTGTRYAMTAEDEMVYQFTHFAKHYRDGGIGCRHVVDLWVYRRENPDLDEAYIRRELGKLGLLEFYGHIGRLMAVWFADGESDPMTDTVTDFIFASGSWGGAQSRVISEGVRDMRRTRTAAEGKLGYLWRMAFPGPGELKFRYKFLQKAPALVPVAWVHRFFYKLLWDRSTLAGRKRELEALSPENLERREEMLRQVGLDYNF